MLCALTQKDFGDGCASCRLPRLGNHLQILQPVESLANSSCHSSSFHSPHCAVAEFAPTTMPFSQPNWDGAILVKRAPSLHPVSDFFPSLSLRLVGIIR